MLETLVILQFVGFVIGVPLLTYSLRQKIKVAAQEASEKTLADYRREHAKELEEFGLYARARYAVYARLYKQLRIAADVFSSFLGLSTRPDFSTFDMQRAEEYFEQHKVPLSARSAVQHALRTSDAAEAKRLLDELHDRVVYSIGVRAFERAKRIEALELLYLSDDVQAQLDAVRLTIAAVSVAVNPRNTDRRALRDEREQEAEMRNALDALYRIMRAELRRV